MRCQCGPVHILIAVQAITLDIFNACLDLAFGLRVITFTDPDIQADLGGIAMETLIEDHFPVLLVDHHQFGLVVDTFFRNAAKVTERLIMHLNKCAVSMGLLDKPTYISRE